MDYGDYDDCGGDIDDYDFVAEAQASQRRVQARERSRRESKSRKREASQQRSQSEVSSMDQPMVVSHCSSSAAKYLQEIKDVYAARDVPAQGNGMPCQINVITMGNVDAGKSTIFGHLTYLLKLQDERTYQKILRQAEQLNKESFRYAYFLDTDKQERERGVTINVNTYAMQIEHRSFVMQDCPGHQDFGDSICRSAIQPDIGVLVVEAHEVDRLEEQIRGQLSLLLILQVQYLLILVNKMDMVNFDQKAFRQIEKQMASLLQQNKIYQKKLKFDVIPVAAMEDIDNNLIDYSEKMKYATMTVKQALLTANISACNSTERSDPYMIISDVYKQDNQLVISCYVSNGTMCKKNVAITRPSNFVLQIVEMVIQDQKVELAEKGQYVLIKCQQYGKQVPGMLTNYDADRFIEEVQTGHIIQPLAVVLRESDDMRNGTLLPKKQRANEPQQTYRIRCKLLVTEKEGICAGEEYDGFCGNQRVAMRINRIDAIMEDDKFIVRNQVAGYDSFCVADIVLAEECMVKVGGSLGRVILRKNVGVSAVGLIGSWE